MNQRFGILIGINDYSVKPLDYCFNDVKTVEEVLIKICDFNENNLRVITSHKENTNEDIETLFYNSLDSITNDFNQGEDSIFFFFSGHGTYQQEPTLLFHEKHFKVSQVYDVIQEKLNPKNQFYIFDACHSGEKIKSTSDEDFFNELYWNKFDSKSENKTIIAASRHDQVATEKKIFKNGTLTHYFIKSIISKENYNNSGFITPSIIADYVRKEVSLDKNFSQIPYTESKDIGSYPFGFLKNLKNGNKLKTIFEEKFVEQKSVIRTAPTVFFSERISKSFPGVRGLKWFSGETAINGLTRFLKEPLRFDEAQGHGTYSDPIWWFRGRSALSITKYRKLDGNKILLNNKELIIDKIAVFNASSYFSSFIYIQTLPDKPSGANKIKPSDIENHKKIIGYSYELFGIYENNIITYEECEDGAAIINGEYTELMNHEFRSRYLSEYNIVIVPKSSPHNSRDGNTLGEKFMDPILKGERTIEEFAKEYSLLPRNYMD